MTRLRPRFPLTVATLWVALLLTALPAGETELSGESENYAASARLEDGMFHVTIVNKVSGKKDSYRDSTRATSLTEISVPETEEWVIVHGKVGSRGDIRFEFNVNYLGYTDRIYQLIRESEHYSVSVQLTEPEEWAEWNRVLDITVVNKHSGEEGFSSVSDPDGQAHRTVHSGGRAAARRSRGTGESRGYSQRRQS